MGGRRKPKKKHVFGFWFSTSRLDRPKWAFFGICGVFFFKTPWIRGNTHFIRNGLRPFLMALTDLKPGIWNLESCTIFLHKFVIWTSRFDDLMDIEITFSYLKSSVLTVVQWMITTSSRAIIWDNDSHITDDIWNQALQSLTCQRLLVSNEQVPSGIIPSHKNAADKISLALKDMSN